ncbi:MAG: hypothetical protein CVU89_00120 [Firmicutes bacterium HGW-Firmicutes-14]|nr:MAG: hypothetical protein CVU89_00120 [Firmicutes bacterium HGW-Firmicutes-14]
MDLELIEALRTIMKEEIRTAIKELIQPELEELKSDMRVVKKQTEYRWRDIANLEKRVEKLEIGA